MDTLDLDFALPLRPFRLELALAVGRETVALVGPSGAGKTSVLRAVAGLVRPERGRIALDGSVLFDAAARIDRPPEERRVGYVFQEYALFPHMTVRQNVAYAGGKRARRDSRPARDHRARPGVSRESSPAVSASASAWPARSRATRASSSWTSRCPRSTRTRGRESAPSSSERSTTSTCPSSWSRTTSRTPPCSPTAWACSWTAGCCRSGRPSELVAAPSDAFVASFTGANILAGIARAAPGGLTEVTLEDGSVLYSVDEGEGPASVVVYPWEISIAREAPNDSSLNHVSRPITSLVRIGNRARVQVGPLVGEVTTASVERLGLREGEIVVASFKAAATHLVARSASG